MFLCKIKDLHLYKYFAKEGMSLKHDDIHPLLVSKIADSLLQQKALIIVFIILSQLGSFAQIQRGP